MGGGWTRLCFVKDEEGEARIVLPRTGNEDGKRSWRITLVRWNLIAGAVPAAVETMTRRGFATAGSDHDEIPWRELRAERVRTMASPSLYIRLRHTENV
jgi:hypothetical protein